MQQDRFPPLAHRQLASFGRQVALGTRSVPIIDESRDSRSRIGTEVFISAAESFFRPVVVPVHAVIALPNALPFRLHDDAHVQPVHVVVVAQFLAATAQQQRYAAQTKEYSAVSPVHRAPPFRFASQSRQTRANLSLTGPSQFVRLVC